MKKATKLLLIMLLAFTMVMSFIACDKENGEETVLETTMTLELVTKGADDSLIDEEVLEEAGVEEYYVITGYSFSTEDAAIVGKAKAINGYYGENGLGKNDEAYQTEKATYNNLKALTLPESIKVNGNPTKLTLVLEGGKIKNLEAGVVTEDADGEAVPVLAIGASAFSGHTELETLVVPDSYLAIGNGAFSGCSALKELTVPFVGGSADALNGEKSFGYIFGTVEFTASASAEQKYNASGSAVYYVPSTLKTVTVTESLSKYAFYNVASVETVNIPATLTEIPEYAFFGCAGIKSFNLASATVVNDGAFSGCTALYAIDLSSVTAIGNSAFEGCGQLGYAEKTVNLSAAETIGEKAFKGCTSLETITIANAVVRAAAFSNCTSLKEVGLTGCTLSIGAFASWSEKLVVTVGANNTVNGITLTAVDHNNLATVFVGAFVNASGTQKANIEYKA